MANQIIYTIASVIIVSLISLVGVFSLVVTKKNLSKILLILVSLSAGTLFGGAFLHLLPEAIAKQGFTLTISLLVIGGVLTFFIIERLIHLRRCQLPHKTQYPLIHDDHPHHIGIINLIGDGLHNFIDGLIIAGSYFISVPVGIATTIAVILHEVPQELGDFGVLLYSGFSKSKALLLNFLSAAIAIVGAIVGLILGTRSELFVMFALPFAAGGFIYIAGSNLIPELHKECGSRDSFWHLFAILVGIGLMLAVKLLG